MATKKGSYKNGKWGKVCPRHPEGGGLRQRVTNCCTECRREYQRQHYRQLIERPWACLRCARRGQKMLRFRAAGVCPDCGNPLAHSLKVKIKPLVPPRKKRNT